ncbi:hypothetical protein [Flavobacterium sp. NRK1]|uniref:hypothetical protein n=1 Tax=Flavobacterium sp. NRK1 TaxID=2954929 RepID=UPI0020931908|nr:hypothetical protein [Flavobacterium sp. NRK1]MCO6149088.1 hypothetical protein [Flavobacterium sp. NRK1]
METIKTFEDACEKLGIPAEINITLPEVMSEFLKPAIANIKLMIIAKALNDGWVPDWGNDDEYKYYPWFDMGGSSGSGFSYNGYGHGDSHSFVSSRLCFKSRALAEYAGTQFADLYKEC